MTGDAPCNTAGQRVRVLLSAHSGECVGGAKLNGGKKLNGG